MKVVVIGATGHIGTYLIPQLVNESFQVVAISRGISKVYHDDPAWNKVETVVLDRSKEPDFSEKIVQMNPDVVIDLINYNVEDTKKMVNSLKKINIKHYIYCSSIWAHGRGEILPEDPDSLKEPLDSYGKDKYQSELFLKQEFKTNNFPVTIIMPGQISGPGWNIINPQATLDINVFQKIANGEKICLPNFGMETLHHVHAFDVAQMFTKAVTHRENALGQSFYAVAKESLTLYGYAKYLYEYFNHQPKIEFLQWDKFCEYLGDKNNSDTCYYHIARSSHFSIEKSEKLLEYSPKYTTLETVIEAVKSYIQRGVITVKK